MSEKHGNHFENPSKLFLWTYSIHSRIITRTAYKKLLKEMNLNGTEKVLEFGSGVGSLGKLLTHSLNNHGELVCNDVNEKFLAQAKNKLQKFSNVKFILGVISKIEIIPNSFVYIVATWVLHHVKKERLEPSIVKFSSILKSNGKIFIIEFPNSQQKNPDFTQDKFIHIFKNNNFNSRVIFTEKRGILYEFTKIGGSMKNCF